MRDGVLKRAFSICTGITKILFVDCKFDLVKVSNFGSAFRNSQVLEIELLSCYDIYSDKILSKSRLFNLVNGLFQNSELSKRIENILIDNQFDFLHIYDASTEEYVIKVVPGLDVY